MATTYLIKLTALPAVRTDVGFKTSFSLGSRPPQEIVGIRRISELPEKVQAFGEHVHAANRHRSFMISTTMANRTQRKPPGFDKATANSRPGGDPMGFFAWTRPEADSASGDAEIFSPLTDPFPAAASA